MIEQIKEALEKADNAIVDKNAHIEGLTVAKEIEIENHTQSCFDYQDLIINKDNELERLRTEHAAMKTALEEIEDESSNDDADLTRINGIAQDILSTLKPCTP